MARAGWALGGAFGSVLIAGALLQPDIPLTVRLALGGLWAAAIWRPLIGVCGFLLAAPIAPAFLAAAGDTPMTGEGIVDALAVATIGGCALHLARHTAGPLARLSRPALILGALLLAGALVDLSLVHLLSPSTTTFLADLGDHLTTTYFTDQRSLASWHLTAHWLEALCLAVVIERLIRATPESGRRLAQSAAIGLTMAAGFSAMRLWDIVMAAPDQLEALERHLFTTRISPFLPDVNATGSLLALATAFWTVHLFTAPNNGRRRLSLGPLVLCALALWLTGSRAAQAAALAGACLGVIWYVRPSRRATIIGATVLLVATAALAVVMPTRTTQSSAAASLGVRWDMAQVSLAVTQTAPWFGVGIGQFREASIPFISEDLMARFPQTRVGENAHNQALQILGEWGVTGGLAWIWLLVVAASGLRGRTLDSWQGAVAGGWCAFLVSALFGHPWLMGPVILLTIPLLGVLAAGGDVTPPGLRARRLTRGLVVAALTVVPWRAADLRTSTDLDHYVVGASRTAGEQEGVPYRITRARSTWFVRVSAQVIDIPLRLEPDDAHTACTVRIAVDGLPANEVRVSADEWTRVRFALTAGKYRQVNRRIDLAAVPETCGLRVGKFTILD